MSASSARPVIGIAGGVGSGKTAVANLLEELGCIVSHSDEDGRAALRDPEIMATLVRWWGRAILDADGAVDRRSVAEIVFTDSSQRERLERLTHPWIETRRQAHFASAEAGTPALVIDAPLLFEAGLDRECDAVIFVECPSDVRRERVLTGRGWDAAELQRREDSQLALDEKRSRADYVIRNDGDLRGLAAQVRTVLDQITKPRRT